MTQVLTFHHIGHPVSVDAIKGNPDTRHSPFYDMYTLDIPNDLSIPIQLHAFGDNSTLHERIRTESHVAFKVENIEAALAGKEILMPLYQPFAGYRCAIVVVNDQLVELIETTLSEKEIWGDGIFKDSVLYPAQD